MTRDFYIAKAPVAADLSGLLQPLGEPGANQETDHGRR